MATVATWQLARFVDFLSDDALISLRYAQRLVRGQGLTWTDGEAVEGYSNLLYVLLAAALSPTGLDWVQLPRVWGIAAFLAAIWAVCVDPAEPWRPRLERVAVAGGLVALTGSLAAWAMGGLEATLQAALVVWAVLTAVRACEGRGSFWWPAGLLGAVVLCRADGAVLWASAVLGTTIALGRRAPAAWPLVALPAVTLGAQQAFRVGYYGDWVPNTARVKVSMTWERTLVGLRYLGNGVLTHGALFAAAGLAVTQVGGRSPRLWLPATTVVGWLAYVAWVGGDIFFAWRHLVPVLPTLALLVSEGVARSADRRWAGIWWVAVAVHAWAANQGERVQGAVTQSWVWTAQPAAELLRDAFGEHRPLLAVDAAGGLPFWWELPALDMLGLTDAWLPRHPPPHWGSGGLGHDLGNGDYVWGRAPDIIAFNGPLGSDNPRWVSGIQLLARDDFLHVYQPVRFLVPGPRGPTVAHYYLRREDGPLAVGRTAREVTVDGWWLASPGAPLARAGKKGLYVPVSHQQAGKLGRLLLEEGVWEAHTPEGTRVDFRCSGRSASRTGADGPPAIEVSRDQRIALHVWSATAETIRVRELTLRRTDGPATHICSKRPWVAESAIATPIGPDGTPPGAPGAFVLGTPGVRVRLEVGGVTGLEVSVDRAHPTVVRWLHDGELLATSTLAEGDEGIGLITHRLPTPEGADTATVIEVVAPTGEGSVGHVHARRAD